MAGTPSQSPPSSDDGPRPIGRFNYLTIGTFIEVTIFALTMMLCPLHVYFYTFDLLGQQLAAILGVAVAMAVLICYIFYSLWIDQLERAKSKVD
ncbi:uncharacterized protein VTP21DRAFT_2252 [Calcarisporiella thermophila]|uniref:uncharacterized protein n=1 Tax=Calcarisporiella thermophila TaxID=911321 RepID=UPI00374353F1